MEVPTNSTPLNPPPQLLQLGVSEGVRQSLARPLLVDWEQTRKLSSGREKEEETPTINEQCVVHKFTTNTQRRSATIPLPDLQSTKMLKNQNPETKFFTASKFRS